MFAAKTRQDLLRAISYRNLHQNPFQGPYYISDSALLGGCNSLLLELRQSAWCCSQIQKWKRFTYLCYPSFAIALSFCSMQLRAAARPAPPPRLILDSTYSSPPVLIDARGSPRAPGTRGIKHAARYAFSWLNQGLTIATYWRAQFNRVICEERASKRCCSEE